jgi:hypothetical protein
LADGTLTVNVSTLVGSFAPTTTIIKNTVAANASVNAPTVDFTQLAHLNLANSASTTVNAGALFLFESALSLTPVAANAPFTASYDAATGLITVTGKGTGSGYGSITVVGTDAAGSATAADFAVAVTSGTGVVTQGGTTTINTAGALYDASGAALTNLFDISGTNTNAVMKGGTGQDTFMLNAATLDFAQINGNTGLDILQLTANSPTIDLSLYNHLGQQTISQVELIDMATDTGANKVTLKSGDIFLLHSNQNDAVNTTTPSVTIKGGSNDIADMMSGGFALSGTANAFTATGAVGTGYSKYTAVYTDASGNHNVEVLLQNGVVMI